MSAAIFSPLLHSRQRVSTQLVHIADWLPTFAHLAGFEIDRPIDGKNQWPALSSGFGEARSDVLINVDRDLPYTSYISGRYKYLNGTTIDGIFDGWLSDYNDRTERPAGFDYATALKQSETAQSLQRFALWGLDLDAWRLNYLRQQGQITCNGVRVPSDPSRQCRPLEAPCLFDIVHDPCERENLAKQNPWLLQQIVQRARKYEQSALPARNQPADLRSNPANFDLTWTYWWDLVGPRSV